MAKKTGGHFRPCNIGSVEAHNERTAEYLEGVAKAGLKLYFFKELSDNNESWVNRRYRGKSCAEIFEYMKNTYKEKIGKAPQLKEKRIRNPKTGREKVIAGWSPIREMVVPVKADTKKEDFKQFIDWARRQGIDIIRIDIHKDEGHRNEAGSVEENFHAHVVADFFDWSTGKTVKLGSDKMSEMQTILAISLGMERGEKKEDTQREYLTHQEYKKMMRALDALTAEEKKAETRIKGITTMLANLQTKYDNLNNEFNKKQEEYDELCWHVDTEDAAYGKIIEDKEKLSKELQTIRLQLTEMGEKMEQRKTQLTSAEDELNTVLNKKYEIQKEYSQLQPKLKQMQKQFEVTFSEQSNFLMERKKAIEELDEEGLIEGYRKKADAYQNYLYRRFPFAKEAINAIAQKTLSRTQRDFTPAQAVMIENAIGQYGEEGRLGLANNILELAQPEMAELNGFRNVNPKWVEQTREEVLQIANHRHPYSPQLDKARASARESAEGGPSYITDLTDWSGNQIKR